MLLSGMTRTSSPRSVQIPHLWYVRTESDLRLRLIASQTPGDPDFPYVGKFIANLTLAQLRTVDCGSKRQIDFRASLWFISTSLSLI